VRKGKLPNGLAQRIAIEAARLAAEFGSTDLAGARRKAAERLGARNPKLWPDISDVEIALREQQRLFHAPRQTAALLELLRIAVQAMTVFNAFRPRLTGPVLEGTADLHSEITLLLDADTPEDVIFFLTDKGIPFRAGETQLNFSQRRQAYRPSLRFRAGDTDIKLIILTPADRRDTLYSPDQNKTLRVGSIGEVEVRLSDFDASDTPKR